MLHRSSSGYIAKPRLVCHLRTELIAQLGTNELTRYAD